MSRPHNLDRTDQRIIDKIYHTALVESYPPTVTELSEHIGLSHTGTWFRLKWLIESGYISSVPKLARTYKVTEKGMGAL